ncbi:hypothetical protein GCM10010404_45730 [Nonomuraea africana]
MWWLTSVETAREISLLYGSAAIARSLALPTRDAAMSSCALVIFAVDLTDLIRCRIRRSWAPNVPPRLRGVIIQGSAEVTPAYRCW